MPENQEFRVSISGLTLSAEQRQQVCGALQRAMLEAMADLDFEGDRVAIVLPLSAAGNGGGGTQGVTGGLVSRSAVEQILNG